MQPANEKILIVAPAWVGDMVMAHTLVQVLKKIDPGCDIHMLAPSATLALCDRMPDVSGGISLNVAHGELALGVRRSVARDLKRQGFATCYVLPNSFKSALTPFFAGIPRRVGWLGEARFGLLNDRRTLDEDRYPLMIERFMALGFAPDKGLERPYPSPLLNADQTNRQRLLAELDLDDQAPALVLCPGAEFGPAKRWPTEHYAAVATHGLAQGYSVWLMGSPKDRADGDAITAIVPGAVNLAGKTTLIDAIDLMSQARAVVCNDSGLMHVASALGRRVIAVYGSTSPAFTPPLGDEPVVLSENLECSPCFARTCPLGHLNCLRGLSPARVIEAL